MICSGVCEMFNPFGYDVHELYPAGHPYPNDLWTGMEAMLIRIAECAVERFKTCSAADRLQIENRLSRHHNCESRWERIQLYITKFSQR